MAGSFVWYWVPGYLFTGLSIFNWVCWIAPKNIVINMLFGINTGLGMSILTFDWAMISAIYNPLMIPVGPTPFAPFIAHIRSFLVVGPNEYRSCIPSYVLAHSTNSLL